MIRRDIDAILQLRQLRLTAAEQKVAELQRALETVVRRHAAAQAALDALTAEVDERIRRHEDRRRMSTEHVGRLRDEQDYLRSLGRVQQQQATEVAQAAAGVDGAHREHATAVRELWRCRQRLDHATSLRSDHRRSRHRRQQRVADEGSAAARVAGSTLPT